MGFLFCLVFKLLSFFKKGFLLVLFLIYHKMAQKINNNLGRKKGGVVGFSCNSFYSQAGKAYCTVGEKYQNYSKSKKQGNVFCVLIIVEFSIVFICF